jgi:hypothetical protein
MQRDHPREEGIGPPRYYVPLRGALLCPVESYSILALCMNVILLTSEHTLKSKQSAMVGFQGDHRRTKYGPLTRLPSSALLQL